MARWGARSPFDIGEAVAVLYDPSHPRDARIDSFFQLWFAPLILGFLGSCSPRSVAAPSLPLCARPTERRCRGRRAVGGLARPLFRGSSEGRRTETLPS